MTYIVYMIPWHVVILENRSKFLIALCTVFIVSLQYTPGAEISLWKRKALFSDNFFIVLICLAFFNIYYICLLSPQMHMAIVLWWQWLICTGQSTAHEKFHRSRFWCVLREGRRHHRCWNVISLSSFCLLKKMQIPFLSSMIICLV